MTTTPQHLYAVTDEHDIVTFVEAPSATEAAQKHYGADCFVLREPLADTPDDGWAYSNNPDTQEEDCTPTLGSTETIWVRQATRAYEAE